MDIQDRLEIKVLEARGLEFQGSKPNCYVQLQVGFDFRSTAIIPTDDTPKWRTKPYIFNSVLAANTETIIVNLYHRDTFAGKDMDLGKVQLSLANYYSAPQVEFR